jgi:AcrR family transcriptional regulator
MAARPLRVPRSDNRLTAVLDAAARLFASKGYSASSMRDIAEACDMLPGSLYYHFSAKEDLLVSVYERGVEELRAGVQAALASRAAPWERLEAACAAHLETVLRASDYAQVLIRVLPEDMPPVAARLRELRDRYERDFASVVAALPLAPDTDRRTLRLLLLGALNWSRFWFNPGGRETPRSLARKFVKLVKESQAMENVP